MAPRSTQRKRCICPTDTCCSGLTTATLQTQEEATEQFKQISLACELTQSLYFCDCLSICIYAAICLCSPVFVAHPACVPHFASHISASCGRSVQMRSYPTHRGVRRSTRAEWAQLIWKKPWRYPVMLAA